MSEYFDDILAPIVGGFVILVVVGVVLFNLEDHRNENEVSLPVVNPETRMQAAKARGSSLGFGSNSSTSSIQFQRPPEK